MADYTTELERYRFYKNSKNGNIYYIVSQIRTAETKNGLTLILRKCHLGNMSEIKPEQLESYNKLVAISAEKFFGITSVMDKDKNKVVNVRKFYPVCLTIDETKKNWYVT